MLNPIINNIGGEKMDYLKIQDISMNFHSKKGITEALTNINFSVEKSDFISIIGPSGCGKSTLLNIIAGLLKPSSGSILYNGKNINNNRNVLGYMFQKDNLFEWLSVWQNICLGLKLKKQLTDENIKRLNNLLNVYGLSAFKEHHPSELSGGMRQRASLIRTLALSPEILLLDEPLCNLDAELRIKMRHEIKDLHEKLGITTIFVTHDQEEALTISHKIAVFNKGKCIQVGTPKEIYSFKTISGVPWWLSGLSLGHCHWCGSGYCCGMDSVSDP